MKRTLLGALLAAFLSLPSLAEAHQEDVPGHSHDPYRKDYSRLRSPQYAAFELRAGPYLPRIDSEFSGATPYEDAFGDKPGVVFGLEGDWQALRIPHFGSFGPGFGFHRIRKRGTAEFEDGTSGSAHDHSIWILPMYAVAVLRVDVLMTDLRIPLVPYIKGGFAWAMWSSSDAGEVTVVDGVKAKGLETGLQVQAGLMVHLNPLSPQAATDMDSSSGVNNAYIFGELWGSDVDSFGRGMQVGTRTWVLGLAIEY